MPWIQIRSRRDPAVWAPFVLILLVVLSAALLAHGWVAEWRDALSDRAASDPEAARAEAVGALRVGARSLALLTAVFTAFLLRYFLLGLREERLPPSGWWSFGAYRVAVGPTARRMSRFGMTVALLLLVAALALVVAVERLVRVLPDGVAA